MSRIFWDCPNCGCETPGILVYKCDNRDCERITCDECEPGVYCECTWVTYDYISMTGRFCHLGKICTQEEWDEAVAARRERDRQREENAARQESLNEKYERELRSLPPLFNFKHVDGSSVIYKVSSSDLYINNERVGMGSIKEINRKSPCCCHDNCPVQYGRGFVTMKDGRKIDLYTERRGAGFLPFFKYHTCRTIRGNITVRSFPEEGSRWACFDINDVLSITPYIPSREVLIGE